MAKRRVAREPEDSGETADIEYYRSKLAIDRVNLDDCLVEQPELYYHVANNHAIAAAERDAAKIEYDDAFAEEDSKLRKQLADEEAEAAADEDGAKKKKGRGGGPGGMTETAIKNQLAQLSRLRDLQWEFHEKKKVADMWFALKEGFAQRSKMLPELVMLMLSQWRDHSIANAGNRARGELSESVRERAGRLRTERRFGKSEE